MYYYILLNRYAEEAKKKIYSAQIEITKTK